MKSRSALFAAAVTTLGVVSMVGVSTVSAQTSGDTIVDKIASRFNLDRNEVKEVFDEQRDEREAERSAMFSENLQTQVDSGEITAEQKSAIEEKLAEIHDSRAVLKEGLEQWAEDNDIELRYVLRSGKLDDTELTGSQKLLIESKKDEIEQKRESQKDELEQWANDNGVNLDDFRVFSSNKGHKGGLRR